MSNRTAFRIFQHARLGRRGSSLVDSSRTSPGRPECVAERRDGLQLRRRLPDLALRTVVGLTSNPAMDVGQHSMRAALGLYEINRTLAAKVLIGLVHPLERL